MKLPASPGLPPGSPQLQLIEAARAVPALNPRMEASHSRGLERPCPAVGSGTMSVADSHPKAGP